MKVLKAKYRVNSNWLHANPSNSASFSWRDIEGVKSTLVKGACRLVGSGVSILVWNDPWIPSLPNFCPHPRDGLLDQQCLSVSQLMNLDKSGWDLDVLKSLFEPDSVRAILNIPRWNPNHPDKWIWVKTTNGNFSVKSMFKELNQERALGSEENPIFKQVWKSNLHHRFKMLLWRIALGVLPTKDSIGRFVSNVDLLCPLCGCWTESVIHLFWDCSLAKALWFGCLDIKTEFFDLTEPSDIVELILFPSNDLKDDPLYCDHFYSHRDFDLGPNLESLQLQDP